MTCNWVSLWETHPTTMDPARSTFSFKDPNPRQDYLHLGTSFCSTGDRLLLGTYIAHRLGRTSSHDPHWHRLVGPGENGSRLSTECPTPFFLCQSRTDNAEMGTRVSSYLHSTDMWHGKRY